MDGDHLSVILHHRQELPQDELGGVHAVGEQEVVVFETSLDEDVAVVASLVEANHTVHPNGAEEPRMHLRREAGVRSVGPGKRQDLAWDNPIEVPVLQPLVLHVTIHVKFIDFEPPQIHRLGQTLDHVCDTESEGVGAGGGVVERNDWDTCDFVDRGLSCASTAKQQVACAHARAVRPLRALGSAADVDLRVTLRSHRLVHHIHEALYHPEVEGAVVKEERFVTQQLVGVQENTPRLLPWSQTLIGQEEQTVGYEGHSTAYISSAAKAGPCSDGPRPQGGCTTDTVTLRTHHFCAPPRSPTPPRSKKYRN
eukprot:Hpha_TRINITY_DN10035_c0_g1::TRINITY_DN10035_c0_g1_i1::g.84154::m.84154